MGWIFLIGVILLLGLTFLLEFLLNSTSKKEIKDDNYVTRTYAPKRRIITSLIFTIVTSLSFVIFSLIFIITEQDLDIGFWFGWTFGSLFVISIPMIILLISLFDYEIIKSDKIMVNRLFGKRRKEIYYSEILKYKYEFNQIMVLDKNNKVLFFVADSRIGIKSIVNELNYHGIFRDSY